MDSDWCLTCEKHIENDEPYCSIECQERATHSSWFQPQLVHTLHHEDDDDDDEYDVDPQTIYHTIDEPILSRWTGNDYAGIEAWAAQIPYGAPAGNSSSPSDDSCSPAFQQQQPSLQPQGISHRPVVAATTPPSLITSSYLRRTLPPSLSMAAPPHVLPQPSNPLQTPKRQPSFASLTPTANASMGQTSLRSAGTGSSLVATPYSSQPVPILRKPSLLDGVYSQVRSWVSPAPIQPQKQQQQHRTHPSKLISHVPSTAVPVFPVQVQVVSSPHSSSATSEKSPVYWMASTVVVKPQQDKPSRSQQQQQRGRKLLGADLADHPSFRTRGRKASRAAA